MSRSKLGEIPVARSKPEALKTLGNEVWSPRGEALLYVVTNNRLVHQPWGAECDSSGSSLYTIGTDGSKRRLLLRAWDIRLVASSPDGSTIAYTGCETRNEKTCGLYTVASDGTGRRLLTGLAGLPFSGDPGLNLAWAPSGKELFVQGDVLNEVDAVTGVRQRLSVPQYRDAGCDPDETLLAISGDGRWIGILSREYYVFADCKDPYKAVVSLVPLDPSAGPVLSLPIVPPKAELDSISLYLK
jgi:hypothetical protein